MTASHPDIPEWIEGEGPDADVVISTRARLARSLASFPFPSRASREDLSMVAQEVRGACGGLIGRFPGLKALSVARLSREEKSYLLDAHLASIEQVSGGEGRLIVLEPRAVLSIMVNEEDHIRLQSLVSGLAPEKAWETVDWADDVLSARLEYGYSERYGYLTASVSNVGTGLRVSAMMHLAGLALTRRAGAQLRAAYELGVSVRGLFGEGSRSVGDLFQVSNEVTLGLSESEIVENVRSVAQYLLCEERLARKELLSEERTRLVDNASRALKVLQSAMSIKPEQAITLMSPVRLAAALGLVRNCARALCNEILVGMQVGSGEDGKASIERAGLLRSRLADIRVVPG